ACLERDLPSSRRAPVPIIVRVVWLASKPAKRNLGRLMRSYYLTFIAVLACVPAAAQTTDHHVRVVINHPVGAALIRATAPLVWRDGTTRAELARSCADTSVSAAGAKPAARWASDAPGSASASLLRVEAADGSPLTLQWNRWRRVYPGALEFAVAGRGLRVVNDAPL